MTEEQRVYIYPKTSCDCFQCMDGKYEPSTGTPTNLSVRDCRIPELLECNNRIPLNSQHDAAVEKSGLVPLNPDVYNDQYSKYFDEIECDCVKGCPKVQYASWDPRLYSATHNQYITFEHPPIEEKRKMEDIYHEKLRNHGNNYGTYENINAGNIMYYTNKSREDPYYPPLFAHPARVSKTLYKDPMGGIKPEYPREVTHPNLLEHEECNNHGYSLSWIRDSQHHREDILSSQMAKINQQRWMPRWTNNN